MTASDNQRASEQKPTPPPATASAAVAGGVGAMAVCCTVTLLVAAGVLGTLSGLAIGGIAVGAGIAVAATIWLILTLIHRRHASHDTCCPPASARPDTNNRPTRDAS